MYPSSAYRYAVSFAFERQLTLCSLKCATTSTAFAAAYRYADQIISSSLWDALRFGPLGPTPFRDDRCTFPLRGLDQDYLLEASPEFTEFSVVNYLTTRLQLTDLLKKSILADDCLG